MKDYSGRTCGLVPQIQKDLNATAGERAEFLVTAKAILALVSALGESRAWRMDVEERGDTALVRFTRRTPVEDDPLNLV
jgi:hypothetical protein